LYLLFINVGSVEMSEVKIFVGLELEILMLWN